MKDLRVILALLAALAIGCSPKDPPTAPKGTNASPGISNAAKPENADAPKPALNELPEELLNDAYEYYGLGYEQPRDFELTNTNSPGNVVTGSQTTTLRSIEDGQAVFAVERTGGIADMMGKEELALKPEGLYTISSSKGKVASPSLQLPKDLTVGSNWEAREKLETDQGPVELTGIFKAVRHEKVKTKAGEFDALLVTFSGKLNAQGQTSDTKIKIWYVRGRGSVKTEMQSTQKGQKTVTVVIQETK